MESDVKCPDERVNKLQFEQIKESQDKIIENQNEHNTRLRILEENKIQMTSEFANLKQSQSDQKSLMLELDNKARDKNDKMFDKILNAQVKNEEKNDKKFDKIEEGQVAIMNKLNEVQADRTGKLEISKGKMVMYAGIIIALITIIPTVIVLFL